MAITLKQIDEKINTFSTDRDKLKKLGHEIAMMIFRHAAPASLPDCDGSGDVTRALKLAKQMPKSWQVQFVNWWLAYSPVRVVVKNDKVGLDPDYKALPKADKPKAWKLDEANENPFYEFEEPDAVAKTLDIDALIALVMRSPKLIETKIKEKLVKPEHVEAAEALGNLVKSMNFENVKKLVHAPANANVSNNTGSDDKQPETAGEQPQLSETLGVELKNVA